MRAPLRADRQTRWAFAGLITGSAGGTALTLAIVVGFLSAATNPQMAEFGLYAGFLTLVYWLIIAGFPLLFLLVALLLGPGRGTR